MQGSPGISPASDVPSVAKALSRPPWQTRMVRSTVKDAMPKTLGPKVLALDRELEPWFTQSEAATACAPCLLLSFSSAVHSQALDTSELLSLTQPRCTSLMPWTWVSGFLWLRDLPELLPHEGFPPAWHLIPLPLGDICLVAPFQRPGPFPHTSPSTDLCF